ncbi:vacuolar protein sorting-associated protein 45, partial [Tremellales sp. Uapishka_1]
MDILKAVQTYVNKILTEVPGMKVLLLDAHTTPIVSLVTTQTELLAHEVYLTDRIDNTSREPLNHLSCIAFLSPTAQSIEWVKQELVKPRYGGYWLYFSNTLTKSQIEDMASVDEFEVVKEVQEYFADYLAQYPSLFTLTPAALAEGGEGPPNPPMYLPSPDYLAPPVLDAHLKAIMGVLLSIKKKPVIRWERMSAAGRKLALEVQWTYQAMVHELVGIVNGRVRIEHEEKPELKDLVLSASSDPFFSQHLFANFGDLGAALASYVSDYQARTTTIGPASSSRIETVADMKRFVEEYPEFKRLGGNVSKHVALVGELSRVVERDDLLAVSEVEQSLASQESHQADLRSVMTLIAGSKTPPANKLRLAILYALRYQKLLGNQISQVVDALIHSGVSADRARLVYVMLNIAGADQRQDDLFMNENFFSRGKTALKGLKGVENVYTQHTPHLSQTLDLLIKGRLREASYPFLEGEDHAKTQRPQDIIVFMLGGTTYEESRAVALLNQQLAGPAGGPGGTRILLGGSTVHNSTSFLNMIESVAENYPQSIYAPPAGSTAPSNLNLPLLSASSSTPSLPNPAPAGPAINLRAGGYELSVGGAGGSGLFRASGGNEIGASFQVPQIPEGIRDGAGRLWGNVRQKVEERVSRTSTPQAGR